MNVRAMDISGRAHNVNGISLQSEAALERATIGAANCIMLSENLRQK